MVVRFTIADSATVSNAQDLRAYWLTGLYIPSGFEGTTLKFKAAQESDDTFLAVYDDANNEVSMTVAASRYIGFGSSANARAVESLPWLKLVAGTSQTGAVEIVGTLAPRAR